MPKFLKYIIFGKKTINSKEEVVLIEVFEGSGKTEVMGQKIEYKKLLKLKQKADKAVIDINKKIEEAEKAIALVY